ncbi:type ISP restriction/modification enzyme [Candidatus Parabeggiatoa sp. HSG14]|uniref:type ISP restriction/modification enzyme n=1 Tax=Candidatus Parabeggiatoa sp. HSG14 TaxID=3055593 RepID=UPI0025A69D96|nr:N-6 DNA methylase [Thiotrichales bacterium HSG14]
MSRLLIQNYHTEVEKIIQYGGSRKETSIRVAFQNLLNGYCTAKNFILIPELEYRTKHDTTVYPDGTVKDALRLPWGYWESKDQDDNLDKEIQNKFIKGYPNDNILFEDSQTAVLIQGGNEIQRVKMVDADKLDALFTHFINYERPEVQDFRKAIECFKTDLPIVINTLRQTLESQDKTNKKFKAAFKSLFTLCQQSINPKINAFDIREMIIQHILTEDIFLTVFNESQFHRENIIAQQLEAVVNTFFMGKVRRETLKSIESYYAVIRREAANISNHHEKQKFLKVVYENFYKTYNPKAADRLGIVYTPNEIVRFMIESTDYLLEKHFNRLLADDDVEILDPATGTGTFITELIEYLPKNRLRAKYLNEIHCNELAILPYYIANLNIEYTYQQKMEEYEAFPHICFVDTLDNLGFEHSYQNQQKTLSIGLGEENAARIQAQNKRKISVIIGNPPYNANQQNENDNNKNRAYDGKGSIDESIKRTYIANSTAQKTKLYDMYARFIRWASNRIDKNGVIAFVSNSSFLEARTFDGFRKVVAEEFNKIYAIDLKGNARMSGERRRKEGGNVFSDTIRVGVAVYFLIKDEQALGCKIYYNAIQDYAKADEKRWYLRENKLKDLNFERVVPDKNHNWLNIADNDFDDLLPLANKETKLAKSQKEERAVFKLFSNGVVTARDEWVYDYSIENLENKVKYLIEIYNQDVEKHSVATTESNVSNVVDYAIKWTRAVKNDLLKGKVYRFDNSLIVKSFYRPFVKKELYFSKELNEMQYQIPSIFPLYRKQENKVVTTMGDSTGKPFFVLSLNLLPDLNFVSPASGGTRCFPLYRYDKDGNRTDNITDWGLNQFHAHYQDDTITKENIFHYTYAVLHHPVYREKYALNLKREFPRLPFYENFPQWVTWGKQLMDLHLNYETIKKYPLKRIDKKMASNKANKPKLKADKNKGEIDLDAITTLQGIPPEAWDYKLGNRSALEWILDQYKEKKPRDKTIAEKFNTYRFADYKETVIELLQRVCTVSVETMRIVGKMS